MSSTTTVRVRAELEKTRWNTKIVMTMPLEKVHLFVKKKKEHLMTATTDVEVCERC